MTTGKLLKTQLGLDNLDEVRIVRFVISSYKVLGVFFDSYRDFLVTKHRISKFPRVATIFSGTDLLHGDKHYTTMTPPMDIEDYDGNVKGALVIPVDLAGDRFINDKEYTKKFERVEKKTINRPLIHYPKGTLKEISLYDLADAGNASDFTQTWRKDRNRVMGAENITAKLVDCVINEAEGSVTFQFLTSATELGAKAPNDNIGSSYRFYSTDKMEVDPSSLSLNRNRAKVYEIQVKILGALEWIEAFEGESIGQKEMKEILEVSDVQVFSTSPSFQFQGFNYWLTQLDASMYPESRRPQRWDAFHGDGEAFLDKHLYGLMRQIKFFINQMAAMLSKKLKSRGLIQ